jgi:hypothetical protein
MLKRSPVVISVLTLAAFATAACGSAAIGGSAVDTTTVTVTVAPAPASTASASATATKTATAAATTTATATATTTAAPAAATASFKPFAGEWVGHTRFVSASRSGRLEAHVGDGCCDLIIDLVLQLSNPRRDGNAWVATTRVVSATAHAGWKQTGRPAPEPGDRGTVRVGADHILVESITGNGFCDPDRTAAGTCGA